MSAVLSESRNGSHWARVLVSRYPEGRHHAHRWALNPSIVTCPQQSAYCGSFERVVGKNAAEQYFGGNLGVRPSSNMATMHGEAVMGSFLRSRTGNMTSRGLTTSPLIAASNVLQWWLSPIAMLLSIDHVRLHLQDKGQYRFGPAKLSAFITAVSSSFCSSLLDQDGGLPDDVKATRGVMGCSAKMVWIARDEPDLDLLHRRRGTESGKSVLLPSTRSKGSWREKMPEERSHEPQVPRRHRFAFVHLLAQPAGGRRYAEFW